MEGVTAMKGATEKGNGWNDGNVEGLAAMEGMTAMDGAVVGQLDGKGQHVGDMTPMDNEDGGSASAMSTRPTMEAIKANTASKH